jgi:hypothetical protein
LRWRQRQARKQIPKEQDRKKGNAAVISKRSRSGVLSATLLMCAGVLQSQGGEDGAPLGALRHGPLVVWYLAASTRPPQSNLNAIAALHNATPLNYSEKTTGTFGQNASNYGQDAGSYGVDADSRTISTPQSAPGQDAPTAKPNGIGYKEQEGSTFGQNAGGYGTASSNNGQEASANGQNAASYGTEASRYGTAASNVGQNASDFGNSTNSGDANANDAQTQAANANAAANQQPLSNPLAEQVKESLRQIFPELQMRFIAVDPDQLKARLMAARGSADYPDVLMGTLPAAWWNGMDAQFGLAMLRPAIFYPNGVTDNPESDPEVAILRNAPHMQAARAFALWMSEPSSGCPGCVQAGLAGSEGAAATVARSAMERLLNGEPLGDVADPALVMDSSRAVRRMLATMGNTTATNDGVSVQVSRASVNGSLAAVDLRVVVSSANVFGVAHPLIVLRAGKDGKWKVLQMSLNLPQHEQSNERQALMVSNPPTAAEQTSGVKGITQASPQDGQSVAQVPQLVWDNRGGAGLQVVEWQRGESNGWSDARLYLVEDRSPTLRTQVDAEFADANGRYRWRVWSVGAHGAVEISPWRTFTLAK